MFLPINPSKIMVLEAEWHHSEAIIILNLIDENKGTCMKEYKKLIQGFFDIHQLIDIW